MPSSRLTRAQGCIRLSRLDALHPDGRARGSALRLALRLPYFRRLRTKLTVYFLALFALVLCGTVSAVYVSVERNAQREVSDQLTASAVVFDRVWQLRTAQLEAGAGLLTRDFGFRAAVATRDEATIGSALDNLRRRMGLGLAAVVTPDGRLLAATGGGRLAAAGAALAADGEASSGVLVLPDGPYEAVSAPILAPLPVGQAVFASRLDGQEMQSLVRLSPIAFEPEVLVQDRHGRWRGGQGGMSQAELSHAASVLAGSQQRPLPVRIGRWVEVVRPLPTLGGERAALVLRYPLAKAVARYQSLLALVLVLGAAGFVLVAAGAWLVAQEVTRPIAALGLAAERLEQGQPEPVAVEGRDEIASLGLAFNRMADGIQRREQALELARASAEAANRAKSDFLANMSHEIRTPLNGILGMAQVIARDGLEPTQHERVRVIQASGEGLLGVLNSILDLSRIEAGQLELEVQDFDLAQLVAGACDPLAATAREKGLAFTVDIAAEAEGGWRGDAMRIRQVLSNLASNAVKFTDHGEVRLQVRCAEGGLEFQVSDTGIGIPGERIDAIFEKFAQADASTTRRFGGAGLGLSICRELVSLMGGALQARSRPGEGSAFTVVLPLSRSAPARGASEPRGGDGPQPLRVLAAEDNATNRLILSALLQPAGLQLTMVEDGQEAVEAFGRQAFDLVLMDIQMPRMNGVEAARAIRSAEQATGRARTPILAVTANVMAHQVQEYAAAGLDAVVAKPVQMDVLLAAIEQALAGAGEVRADAVAAR